MRQATTLLFAWPVPPAIDRREFLFGAVAVIAGACDRTEQPNVSGPRSAQPPPEVPAATKPAVVSVHAEIPARLVFHDCAKVACPPDRRVVVELRERGEYVEVQCADGAKVAVNGGASFASKDSEAILDRVRLKVLAAWLVDAVSRKAGPKAATPAAASEIRAEFERFQTLAVLEHVTPHAVLDLARQVQDAHALRSVAWDALAHSFSVS